MVPRSRRPQARGVPAAGPGTGRIVRRVCRAACAFGVADADLKGVDAVVVPGGFSYGDYLRAGAIA
ncbi:hypothetical protein ACNJQJ_22635, partial [Mycobacterium tuberculosis]